MTATFSAYTKPLTEYHEDYLQSAIEEAKQGLEALDKATEEAYRSGKPTYDLYRQQTKLRDLLFDLEKDLQVETSYIGQPATYGIGSDRYAGQVTAIERFKSGDKKHQVSVIVFGFERGQRSIEFRKTNRGWRAKGGYGSIRLGVAEDYRDPSF
jgi:hypothetical protein